MRHNRQKPNSRSLARASLVLHSRVYRSRAGSGVAAAKGGGSGAASPCLQGRAAARRRLHTRSEGSNNHPVHKTRNSNRDTVEFAPINSSLLAARPGFSRCGGSADNVCRQVGKDIFGPGAAGREHDLRQPLLGESRWARALPSSASRPSRRCIWTDEQRMAPDWGCEFRERALVRAHLWR